MKLRINTTEMKKSAKKMKKVLEKLKDLVENNNIFENAAENWRDKVEEEMDRAENRKLCDASLYMYRKHGVEPGGLPPLKNTGTLRHNLIHWYDGLEEVYKIGFNRDALEFPSGESYWARDEIMGKGIKLQEKRSAKDGFMITAATLEFGSNKIYIPPKVARIFKISGSHFSIPPRLFLTSTYSKENRLNVKRIVCKYIKDEVRKL